MEIILIPVWLALSITIGVAGTKREIGFFAAFMLSLVLSPVLGLIITAFSRDKATIEFRNMVIELLEKKQINYDDL